MLSFILNRRSGSFERDFSRGIEHVRGSTNGADTIDSDGHQRSIAKEQGSTDADWSDLMADKMLLPP